MIKQVIENFKKYCTRCEFLCCEKYEETCNECMYSLDNSDPDRPINFKEKKEK